MKQILKGNESGWWMLSDGYDVWLPEGMIPYGDANQYGLIGLEALLIGEWQNAPVWLIRSKKREQMSSVRLLLSEDKALFDLVGRAVQLSKFYLSHQFCGYCGQRMVESETEWCCLCNHCRQRYYPQIAPSIIVVVKRENALLLARHAKHKKPLYTALAGFVEVGETVEQAVHREVFEETHIKIRNLRYVASQPWPFPHSLMMAYLADYDSGDIAIDPHELVDASWYHYNQLPLLPPVGTIARRLIEDTVALCRHQQEYSFE